MSIKILRKLRYWLCDFELSSLYSIEELEYVKYSTPRVEGDIFGIYTKNGYLRTKNKAYTKIGQWFENNPPIFKVVLLPVIILNSFRVVIGLIIWGLIEIMLPKSVRDRLD